MRRIPVGKWAEKLPGGTREAEVSLVNILTLLINGIRPERMPRGFESFRIFSRVARAFESAEKTGVLELEEREYEFLLGMVKDDIPANWASNPDIVKAMESLFGAKEE
jgi:hypothetical protein